MSKNAVLEENATMFDAYCNELLKRRGMRVQTGTDVDGHAIIELVDIPASILSAIERRLHHTGMSKAKPTDLASGGTNTASRLASLRLRGTGKLPPISEDRDAATG